MEYQNSFCSCADPRLGFSCTINCRLWCAAQRIESVKRMVECEHQSKVSYLDQSADEKCPICGAVWLDGRML